MLLVITISILFIYTVVLIAFFMGWCALIPTMCHPRKEIPFCSVKSPRRNTKYVDIETTSHLASIEHLHRNLKSADELETGGIHPSPLNDYLHPKYSLPFIGISVLQQREYFERFLRVPAQITTRNLISHSKRTELVEKKEISEIFDV